MLLAHVCACVYMHVCTCTCVWICVPEILLSPPPVLGLQAHALLFTLVRGFQTQSLMFYKCSYPLNCLSSPFVLFFYRQDLSLNLEITNAVRLADQPASGTLLSHFPTSEL